MTSIKSAITASLVEEARGGPFVFWDGLEDAFNRAKELGFDAVEIFAPGPDAVAVDDIHALIEKTGLSVAAVGTGAGMVKHGLSLTDTDAEKRSQAVAFVKSMIEFGANFGAPAIIGSMQGRWGGDLSQDAALGSLAECLNELGGFAASKQVTLIYEPLNRYETNLIKTVEHGVSYLKTLATDNVRLLADLFHMNIEEANLADAIRHGGQHIGHVHFVDSNRQATGLGHMDYAPIAAALKEIEYAGYLSAEAFPLPDSQTAAEKTIEAFRSYF